MKRVVRGGEDMNQAETVRGSQEEYFTGVTNATMAAITATAASWPSAQTPRAFVEFDRKLEVCSGARFAR